jgi:hypothetical protein
MARGTDRLASLTSDLLARDLPDATPDEVVALGRATAEHLCSLPDATRAGVRVAQAAVSACAAVLGRRPYSSMPAAQRADAVHRLAGSGLPLVAEYFRLVRGVALVIHREERP